MDDVGKPTLIVASASRADSSSSRFALHKSRNVRRDSGKRLPLWAWLGLDDWSLAFDQAAVVFKVVNVALFSHLTVPGVYSFGGFDEL